MITNSILGKTQSIFITKRIDEPTKKPGRKGSAMICTEDLNPNLKNLLEKKIKYTFSEKIDGTCCLIRNGKLHKRRDVKPKYKRGKLINANPTPPNNWIPTSEKDKKGHWIGFLPLDEKSNDDKYHRMVLNEDRTIGKFLFFKNNEFYEKEEKLSNYNEKTVELIGPKINGNLYNLNDYYLVIHGSIPIIDPPEINLKSIKKWFNESKNSGIEGFVIHFENGDSFKLHRYYLKLPWDSSIKKNLIK